MKVFLPNLNLIISKDKSIQIYLNDNFIKIVQSHDFKNGNISNDVYEKILSKKILKNYICSVCNITFFDIFQKQRLTCNEIMIKNIIE